MSVVEKDIFHQEKIRNIVVKNVNEKLTMKDRKTESMNIHAYIVEKIFLEKQDLRRYSVVMIVRKIINIKPD